MAEEEDGTVTDITAKLADALREAEDALAWCYNVQIAPGEKTSPQHKALASVRAALTAYTASQSTPDDETVERVARAIYEGGLPKGGRDYVAWEDLDSEGFYAQHDLAMKQARAALSAIPADDALEALRELSEVASPGEWRREPDTANVWDVLPNGDLGVPLFEAVRRMRHWGRDFSVAEARANVQLAADAVNYVRAKLAAPAQERWS